MGSALTGGIVPKTLVGAYDTYLPTNKPTVRGHWVVAIGRHGSFVITTPLAEVLAVGPVNVNGSTITLPPDAAAGFAPSRVSTRGASPATSSPSAASTTGALNAFAG